MASRAQRRPRKPSSAFTASIAASCQPLEARLLLAASPTSLYINAGGASTVDSIGRPFAADTGFTAGSVSTDSVDYGDAATNSIFDSSRQGPEVSFSQPLANGHYDLFLEFADAQSTSASQNVMDVSVQGAAELNNVDIFAAVGADTPTAKEFDVDVTNGTLSVDLSAVSGEAFVNAIVAVPTDVPVAQQAYSWEGLTPEQRESVSATNLSDIGQLMLLYSNINRGHEPPDLATAYLEVPSPLSIFASPLTNTQLPRAQLTTIEEAAWITSRSDFIYVGKGLTNASPPTTVDAYENPQRVSGGLNVLYSDGTVHYLDRADAAALLGFDPNAPLTGGAPITTTQQPDPRVLQSEQNLLNIGSSLLEFTNDNRGTYPMQPGGLTGVYGAQPDWFVDPRGSTPLPPAGLTGADAQAFINASTDYIYLAAGKRGSELMPADVLMVENPSVSSDGLLLLLADGTVQYEEPSWAMQTLRAWPQGYGPTTPLAEIARPNPVVQSETIQLNGAGIAATRVVHDARTARPIVSYQWDFNYDGNPADFQTDATGPTPTFTATTVPPTGQQTIALQVSDIDGITSAIATMPLSIIGASISGAVTTVDNQPIAQMQVYLDANNNSELDPGELTTTTDALGNYQFTNVPAGAYIVRQVLPSNLVQITPSYGYGIHLTVSTAASLTNESFVDAPAPTGAITGSVAGAAAGETIYLDSNNNSTLDAGELSTTTADDGSFSFTNVPVGAYIVRQLLPPGVVQITPSHGYGVHLTVIANQTLSTQNFTDTTGGSITGAVVGGIPGQTIYLDTNNNSRLDPGELSTITQANGTFSFSDVPPGAYIIRQLLPPKYVQIAPSNNFGIHINLPSGGVLANENFIDALPNVANATISGIVFNDTNDDGLQDNGEMGLAGWTVFIDWDNTGTYVAGDPIATTDANGQYMFKQLAVGAYIVRVVAPSGFTQTSPADGLGHHATVAAGQQVQGENFGEFASDA